MQGTGSRENGRGVGYVGAREMALHSSSKDRSDAIAAVRYTLGVLYSISVTFHQFYYLPCYWCFVIVSVGSHCSCVVVSPFVVLTFTPRRSVLVV